MRTHTVSLFIYIITLQLTCLACDLEGLLDDLDGGFDEELESTDDEDEARSSNRQPPEELGERYPDGPFEPISLDHTSTPTGKDFFTFYHAFPIHSTHQIEAVSILYTPDGERLLVSDTHSSVYLFNITDGALIWKYEVYPDTPFDLRLGSLRPDGKEFTSFSGVPRDGGERHLNIHSIEDGRIIKQIEETSDYVLEGSAYSGDSMIPMIAYYERNELKVVWQNFKRGRSLHDLSLRVYDPSTHRKQWSWQIVDPRGIYNNDNGRHIALYIWPTQRHPKEYLLFSETGEVRLLNEDLIERAAREPDLALKPHGELLYTLEINQGHYPTHIIHTSDSNKLLTAFTYESEGHLAYFDPFSGETDWWSDFKVKVTGIGEKGDGRFIFLRSFRHWYVWDHRTGYLTASGPRFFSNKFNGIAVHPKKREFAVGYKNFIYFLMQRPKRTVMVNTELSSIDLYLGEYTEVVGTSSDDQSRLNLCLSPEITASDGIPLYCHDGGKGEFYLSSAWSDRWRELYLDRHEGRQIHLQTTPMNTWHLYGGFTEEEARLSIDEIRAGLRDW